MPRQSGPVGPFPPGTDPEEYDKRRRRVIWAMPSGLYLLGSRAGGRRNLMTLSWATPLATEPKLVGVGVERDAVTHQLVSEGGGFALSLVARDDRTLARKFSKPAAWDPDARTLNGFAVRDAPVTGCPVPEAAVGFLDCRVERAVELGSHTLFVGEVVDAGFLHDEETPVLRMEDTRMSYGG